MTMRMAVTAGALLVTAVACGTRPVEEAPASAPVGPASHWLEGAWSAQALGGVIREEWLARDDQTLEQRGVFVENEQIVYAETVRIEQIDGGLYLIALPADAPPRIFSATSASDDQMVFECQDGQSPYMIVYESLGPDAFRRTLFQQVDGEERTLVLTFGRE